LGGDKTHFLAHLIGGQFETPDPVLGMKTAIGAMAGTEIGEIKRGV
jgi:hypothetical protein